MRVHAFEISTSINDDELQDISIRQDKNVIYITPDQVELFIVGLARVKKEIDEQGKNR